MGLKNVTFQQGDVSALPYADGSFDAVLSLNGFHAFPDKEAAYRETCRVLKPGGTFCGCFYVEGAYPRYQPAHPPSLPAHEVLHAALRDGGQPGSQVEKKLRPSHRRPREEHLLVRLPQGGAGMNYFAFGRAHRRWLKWRKGG